MSLKRILLVRHAHSKKNVEDRHGGSGMGLTAIGKSQIQLLSRFVADECKLYNPVIIYSESLQVIETASELARLLSCSCKLESRVAPMNFGVLAGLSREEAGVQFPEAARRLDSWRLGVLRIADLNILGAESIAAFWRRGQEALLDYETHHNGDLIVVGTRSILILLLNVVLSGGVFDNETYKNFEFDNCGATLLVKNAKGQVDTIFQNRTDFLTK